MFGAIVSGISGIYSSLLRQRTAADNAANINTPGFKATQAEGTAFNVSISQRQGAFISTGEPLDLAIEGNGFFKVIDDDGNVAYTRAGRFHIDSEGYLATQDGFRLSPPIQVGVDNESIRVTPDGVIWGKDSQTGQIGELGRLRLSQFANPSGLTPAGGGKYTFSAESGAPTWGSPGIDGLGSIRAGGVEASNVDIAREMVDQTLAQRGVEANLKTIQAGNEMLGTVLDIVD